MKKNSAFERGLNEREHRVLTNIHHKGLSVVLTEGGPYFYKERRKEYPHGWFEGAYMIFSDETFIFGQVIEFDFTHDLYLSDESRRNARKNSVKKAAIIHIDDALEVWNAKTG